MGSANVEVRLTESFSSGIGDSPVMRHRRCFSNASTEQVLSLFLDLKFCGKDGLMEDSTAAGEERSADGNSRFMPDFKPLGRSLASAIAGSFGVRQELLRRTQTPRGMAAEIRMTFSPPTPTAERPAGSFLWKLEPEAGAACWTEWINTPETAAMGLPQLRVKSGSGVIFRFAHDRLMTKIARRIARALNGA